ncbi:TPA: ORF6N domain-containing protein [Yersinia enterocolitica]|uniref:ORF6N domain-containing protein n=1 Tax=Yersinia TaxID=629 RepID=UPI0011A9249D|nr:ORF6N domain-containing protein [Yersinia alsatica]EKN3986542.1 ORF6N domain-containing protein [Yersinia enterocolitica]HDM8441786.1 ORF6N domain-containing protein [Yersinia enterocolitica]HDV0805817.1 ORF6N domain-containing protein [Yersinia enterocolitica]HDZ9670337.1 ORF6N domain-containing protein [Yersinia enterocolitica]
MQQSLSTAVNVANLITVVDLDVPPVIEWRSVRVVTTETLAKGYGTKETNIRTNLDANRERFLEGVHIFTVTGDELADLRVSNPDAQISNKARSLTLWTEKGAARMSKIVDTDEAWDFFERMETAYFHPRQNVGIPLTYEQALEDLLVKVKENRIITEQRDQAIVTKAWIGKKREATAMATASAEKRKANALAEKLGECKKHATIKAVQRVTGEKYGHWPMKKWCETNGMEPKVVPDETYGTVKSWPAEAWKAINDIDLRKVF